MGLGRALLLETLGFGGARSVEVLLRQTILGRTPALSVPPA